MTVQEIAAKIAPQIRQAIANGVTDKFVEQQILEAIRIAQKQMYKTVAKLSRQQFRELFNRGG